VADGFRLTVRKSKTDQEGEGAEIAIPRGYRLRPVEAVQERLAAADLAHRTVRLPDQVTRQSLIGHGRRAVVQ
jgi:hypothetical protein